MRILKSLFTIVLLITFVATFAQKTDKYSEVLYQKMNNLQSDDQITVWIYFKDKPGDWQTNIKKAENIISEKSLLRRQKLIKSGALIGYHDIPVERNYINNVIPYVEKFRQQSRWLNAISAEVRKSEISKIANLSFVSKIDIVRKGKNILPDTYSDTDLDKAFNPKYNYNYGTSLTQVEQINVPFVHDLGYTGEGITICVLDAGFNNLEHQVFSSMDIADQWDFVNNDGNVDDEADMGTGDHGTMTLSTIGGFFQGQLIGPAFGATFLLAKTENTDSETQVEEDNWVAGAEWADALGADITSTSLGYITFDDGTGYSPDEMDGNTAVITIAADIAASLGILVVNSAGNEGGGVTTIGAPADGDSVLAVGAVYSDGSRTYFSSVGPTADGRIKPDVMAMGSGVCVADPYGPTSYTYADGTSFSCPLTAGAAALLWQMAPNASNMEIYNALKMSANNAQNPNNEYGWGILDIYAAYEYLALPQIVHSPLPDSENMNGPYTVNVEVTSQDDLVQGSPIVVYRKDVGNWIQIPMTANKETGAYFAEIAGDGTPGVYDYYITAENTNALVSLPSNAPTAFFTFNIGPDSEAPVITHNPIKEYYVNLWSQAAVVAQITDNIQLDPSNTFVEWKINGTEQDNIYFVPGENNTYTAWFPFSEVQINDLIEYRINAQDLSLAQNVSTFPVSGYQSFNITDRISFEQNTFSENWIFSGDQNWFVSTDQHQHGSYSAKSGDIDDSQISSIEITFSCDVNGNIVFYKRVSSEEGWDYLNFYINDGLQDQWSGELSWSEESYAVTPGTYTIKWEYSKDISVSEGSDCGWIDNITFPGTLLTYSVTFNVTDGTNAIQNANINFRSQNVLTDINGQAIFQTIPPGNNIPYIVTKEGYDSFNGSITITDQNVIENVTLNQALINIIDKDNEVTLYPNPAEELIYISCNQNIEEICIFDMAGRLVKELSGNLNTINVSEFKNGIYYCKIQTEKGSFTKKLIIK
jgi:serine protease AprX